MPLYSETDHPPVDWSAPNPFDANWAHLNADDAAAKAGHHLLGRYVSQQIGDGKSIYQITTVNRTTVRLTLCVGLGDDWQIAAWGQVATVPTKTVLPMLAYRDRLDPLLKPR